MIYAFVIIYMLLLPVTFLLLLLKILNTIENIKIEPIKEETKVQRKHFSVGQPDFDNAFGGRKAYSIYKNKNGLYEPVMPTKGIPLKKEEG